MPWWCLGVEETRKMVISYDDLLKRLWVGGACRPFMEADLQLTDDDKAPVPHSHWVNRLGFQQNDPVTDFRSGGVLSLAMMVHLVEACPETHARFTTGSAAVLPFGLTSINITDMMARFLMLSKAVDRMDALLSQKPFWRMFADPHALLVCQQVSMDVTADVVDELTKERGRVTVFDFAEILKIVEDRVERDLLGAGPQSVSDLRALYQRNRDKYERLQQRRLGKRMSSVESAPPSGELALGVVSEQDNEKVGASVGNGAISEVRTPNSSASPDQTGTVERGRQGLGQSMWNQASSFRSQATKVAGNASSFAGNVFAKIKSPGFSAMQSTPAAQTVDAATSSTNDAPDLLTGSPPKEPTTTTEQQQDPSNVMNEDVPSDPTDPVVTNPSGQPLSDDEDWAKVLTPATESIGNFSIEDETEDTQL
jgi:hypothetical protein